MNSILVVANWKMNPQKEEDVKNIVSFSDRRGVVICPPFVFLKTVKKEVKKASLGAQNCFYEKKGAFTGETSLTMLKNQGCEYVVIGHSERRENFNENDENVKRKIKAALEEKITPIVCVGEEEERLKSQLSVFKGFPIKKIIIAYEPKSAIGTGIPCDVNEAEKKKVFIKSVLARTNRGGEDAFILYGGSVDSKNVSSYIKEAGFQGVLIGGASLKQREFEKILENLSL